MSILTDFYNGDTQRAISDSTSTVDATVSASSSAVKNTYDLATTANNLATTANDLATTANDLATTANNTANLALPALNPVSTGTFHAQGNGTATQGIFMDNAVSPSLIDMYSDGTSVNFCGFRGFDSLGARSGQIHVNDAGSSVSVNTGATVINSLIVNRSELTSELPYSTIADITNSLSGQVITTKDWVIDYSQPIGTYNTIIGTSTNTATSGGTIISDINVTDGVITSTATRALSYLDVGAASKSTVTPVDAALTIYDGTSGSILKATTASIAAAGLGTADSLYAGVWNAGTFSNASKSVFAYYDANNSTKITSQNSASASLAALLVTITGTVTAQIASNGDMTNTNNSYGALSDKKLKENIHDSSPKLDKLMKVRVVDYNLKTRPDEKLLGVIAQEIEEIFPGIITVTEDRAPNEVFGEPDVKTGETTKSVKYSVLYMMMLKGMQEQQEKINYLEDELSEIKNHLGL